MNVTVNQDGQVQLPADVCESLAIRPGSILDISVQGGVLELRRLTRGAEGLSGTLWRPGQQALTFEDINAAGPTGSAGLGELHETLIKLRRLRGRLPVDVRLYRTDAAKAPDDKTHE